VGHGAPLFGDGCFLKPGAEYGSFDPSFLFALFQCSFQNGALDIFGNGDVARHDEQFKEEALLRKDIGHMFVLFNPKFFFRLSTVSVNTCGLHVTVLL